MVENLGDIHAQGGQVLMSIAAADTVLESIINVDGYIDATSVSTQNGKVIIQGYDNSHVTVAGDIDVSGNDAGESGGVVQVSADYIQLAAGSEIDASGDIGAGTIHIGSDQYHNPKDDPTLNTFGEVAQLRTAQYLYMEDGAYIYADAVAQGDGGDIVLWADQYAWIYGDIYARGGALSGDGGRIETSGYKYLDVVGVYVNASALNGMGGEWLLDPTDIEITVATNTDGGFSGINPINFIPTASPSQASASDITTALNAGTSVVVSTNFDLGGTGDITFDVGADIIANGGTDGVATLSLIADHDIDISEDITGTFNLLLTASNNIIATGNIDVYDYTQTSGSFSQNTATLPTFQVRNDFTVSGGSFQRFAGGNGVGSPYQIVDFYGLYSMNTDLTANYVLNNAIDGNVTDTINVAAWNNGAGFTPIASIFGGVFTGSFNGNNHTISDVTISLASTGNNAGMFSSAMGATFTDIRIDNINVDAGPVPDGNIDTGSLLGHDSGSTFTGTISITNGVITASLGAGNGGGDAGGVIGVADGSNINNANISYQGTVTGQKDNIGGIFGRVVNNADISGTLNNSAAVTSTADSVGGIAGSIESSVTISAQLLNSGDITGNHNVGGIIGLLSSGASLTGNVGSTSAATIDGAQQVGGIVGNMTGATLNAAYSRSTVTGDENVGGIVGLLTGGTVSNTMFGGTVTSAGDNIGGIVGQTSGTNTVSNILAIGTVSGSSSTKGVILGLRSGGTTLTSGIIDSSLNSGVPGVGSGSSTGVLSRSHNSLGNVSTTYVNAGFSFPPWKISSGFYAAPSWCTSLGCAVSFTATGGGSNGPELSSNTLQTIDTQLINAETGNLVNLADSGYNSTVTVEDAFAVLNIEEQYLAYFDDVYFFDPEGEIAESGISPEFVETIKEAIGCGTE
jgi:hypothetical protein